MKDTKVYSLDEVYYTTDLEEIENMLEQDGEITGDEVIYVGEQVKVYHKQFINIDSLIESMQDSAYNEYSDGYLGSISKEELQKAELAIIQIFNKYFEQPTWFHVKNVKEIKLKEVS